MASFFKKHRDFCCLIDVCIKSRTSIEMDGTLEHERMVIVIPKVIDFRILPLSKVIVRGQNPNFVKKGRVLSGFINSLTNY